MKDLFDIISVLNKQISPELRLGQQIKEAEEPGISTGDLARRGEAKDRGGATQDLRRADAGAGAGGAEDREGP